MKYQQWNNYWNLELSLSSRKSFLISESHTSKQNPLIIPFETSIYNVKLPHCMFNFTRELHKMFLPLVFLPKKLLRKPVKFLSGFSLIYLNLHTHVSLGLSLILHTPAYVLSFSTRDLWSKNVLCTLLKLSVQRNFHFQFCFQVENF